MTSQLALWDRPPAAPAPRIGEGRHEHYGPWPAPSGWYSHFVVWRTCLVWELRAWIDARGGAA